jgi:hypothetical protein
MEPADPVGEADTRWRMIRTAADEDRLTVIFRRVKVVPFWRAIAQVEQREARTKARR